MNSTMRTPCEWTLSDFVPKIRRELVNELHTRKGYNQKEIAKILGISQPRVSQYISSEKKQIRNMEAAQFQLMESQLNDVVTRTVNDIIKALENNKKAPETIPIICYSCRELRMGNALCSLHRYDYPELNEVINSDKNCDLCLKWKTAPNESVESLNSLDARFNVLKTLESISNMLVMKVSFVDFIPQIGAQLCMIFESSTPDSPQDIAGFPGRIIQIQGRAKIVSRPEFNSSKTTSSLLIDIRKSNRKLTAVLSIKNQQDADFETSITKKGFIIFKTQAIDENGLSQQIISNTYSNKSKIAILDSGSIGFESITYLFVENIIDLVDVFD